MSSFFFLGQCGSGSNDSKELMQNSLKFQNWSFTNGYSYTQNVILCVCVWVCVCVCVCVCVFEETYCHSDSSERPSAHADVKNSQGVTTNI